MMGEAQPETTDLDFSPLSSSSSSSSESDRSDNPSSPSPIHNPRFLGGPKSTLFHSKSFLNIYLCLKYLLMPLLNLACQAYPPV